MKNISILFLVCILLLTACSKPIKGADTTRDLDFNQNQDSTGDKELTTEDKELMTEEKELTTEGKEATTEKKDLTAEVTDSTSEPYLTRNIEFLYHYDCWTLYDNTKAVFKSKEDYEKTLRSYIKDIEELLHKENWLDNYDTKYKTLYIKLKITDKQIGAITVPVEYTNDSLITYLTVGDNLFLNNYNPIIHELTHLVSYNPIIDRFGLSISLNDGLAEYVNKQIGGEDTYCIKNIPIHDYLTQYLSQIYQLDIKEEKENDYINSLATDEKIYKYQTFSQEWMYFFMCNVSFVDYVIQEYGIDYFMNLHDYIEGDENIKNQQKQMNELKTEWIEFLNSYQYQMTYDEINAIVKGNLE